MKKNVIMIVVDAFFVEYLGKKDYKNSSTPFLDSLIKENKAYSVNNMYSQAPYTEAAMNSLLGGTDTMYHNSYMRKMKNTDSLLKIYSDNGYKVFSNSYQSSTYPSGTLTGANELFYNSAFNFPACYEYRIKNFAEKKELTQKDYDIVIDILEDNFKEELIFLNAIQNKDESVDLLYNNFDISNLSKEISKANIEYNNFKKNKLEYAKDVVYRKKEHSINSFYTFPTLNKIDDKEVLLEIERRYKSIINKIFWKNFWYNLKNNRLSIKKINLLIKNKKKNVLKNYVKSYFSCIIDKDLKSRINHKTYNTIKTITSCDKQFKHFITWNEKNGFKPFFAHLHIDDIHFREMFFTHDTKDLNQLDEEFDNIKKYIKNLPSNYKGNLTYDLGVLYVDSKIRMLFDYLKNKKILKDCDVIITADHGNSYSFQNIRESYVINFYEENYHIPCIIYTNNKLKFNNNKFYETKDIASTIVDLNELPIPSSYTGTSLRNFEGRDYAVKQYIGSGCPDMNSRNILLNVRTKKYSVSGNFSIHNCDIINITSVFDLISDPKENIDLLLTDKNYDISYEMSILKNEAKKIRENNNEN